MGNNKIQKIIDETVFTMEIEGFMLTSDEKESIRKALSVEVNFADQLRCI